MIIGKKIILRAYKIEDIEPSHTLINNINLRNNLNGGYLFPLSLESQKEYIEKAMVNSGPMFSFAIEEKNSGKYIGGCGINSYNEKNRNVTVGLWLGEEFQGKGYGSDTLRTLCSHIFNEMNIHKIKLQYYKFNTKCEICYKKVGFKEEGVLRDEIFRYGKYHDIIVMGLFREDLIMK
ncbi:GNAT family N-acetyltransferase [Fusobacterium sp. PH5-44]|uniref:GNAT family N-acetyltransferase n=1 Tax=unclassified Fusobacterium TaxID=2648384 RepID=UPI003D1C933C